MALVSTGGIDPLYSGAQITHRGAAISVCWRPASAGGVPAARARGVNSGSSTNVRSSTSTLRFWACARAAKRSDSLRFSPLLQAITNKSGEGRVVTVVLSSRTATKGASTSPAWRGCRSGDRALGLLQFASGSSQERSSTCGVDQDTKPEWGARRGLISPTSLRRSANWVDAYPIAGSSNDSLLICPTADIHGYPQLDNLAAAPAIHPAESRRHLISASRQG